MAVSKDISVAGFSITVNQGENSIYSILSTSANYPASITGGIITLAVGISSVLLRLFLDFTIHHIRKWFHIFAFGK